MLQTPDQRRQRMVVISNEDAHSAYLLNVKSFNFLETEQPDCIYVAEWKKWARARETENIHQWLRLTGHLLSRGLPIGAEHAARRALELSADNHDALMYLGQALYNQGRDTESEETFSRLVKLRPAWEEAHYNKGLVLSQLGRLEDARESFIRTIQLNPGFEPARENLKLLEKELTAAASERPSFAN